MSQLQENFLHGLYRAVFVICLEVVPQIKNIK